tara:strand:+ start:241 stop:447 length:207 start_codon:yes stop_codon:yes gene_type:complete
MKIKLSNYIIFILINLSLYYLYDFEKDHFNIDNILGFYPLFGFFACLILIIIAKALSYILKRDDKYYD